MNLQNGVAFRALCSAPAVGAYGHMPGFKQRLDTMLSAWDDPEYQQPTKDDLRRVVEAHLKRARKAQKLPEA